MIPSLKKAFAIYYRHPFIFAWASFVYVVLQVLFALAAAGLFIVYFFLASSLGISTAVDAAPTLIAGGIVVLAFMFFSSGLNAGLLKGYVNALESKKTTLAELLRYAFQKAPVMFAIMALRGLLLLAVCAPVIAAYVMFLSDIEFMDILAGLYLFSALFLVDFLFTPAFITAGAFGSGLIPSLRTGLGFLRRKHVNAFGLYILFAVVWALNFIPLMQLFSLFVLFPVVYSAFIVMFQGAAAIRGR